MNIRSLQGNGSNFATSRKHTCERAVKTHRCSRYSSLLEALDENFHHPSPSSIRTSDECAPVVSWKPCRIPQSTLALRCGQEKIVKPVERFKANRSWPETQQSTRRAGIEKKKIKGEGRESSEKKRYAKMQVISTKRHNAGRSGPQRPCRPRSA